MLETVYTLIYMLLFYIIPLALLIIMKRVLKVKRSRTMFLSIGVWLAYGGASWHFLFGHYFTPLAEPFFLLNLPLGIIIIGVSDFFNLSYNESTVLHYALPVIIYPGLGFLVGKLIDDRDAVFNSSRIEHENDDPK